MYKAKNLIGRRFNKLVVIGRAENTKGGVSRWICRCDCGGESISQRHFLINKQISCKTCKKNGKSINLITKLNEYHIWRGMKQRCQNPNQKKYKNYGGRGISVCERWEKFERFYADMGPRPSKNHTLERINNNGNYKQSNCRWATYKEQNRNKRDNIILEFNGHKMSLIEWSEFLNIKYITLCSRLKGGWSIKDMFTTPTQTYKLKQ